MTYYTKFTKLLLLRVVNFWNCTFAQIIGLFKKSQLLFIQIKKKRMPTIHLNILKSK